MLANHFHTLLLHLKWVHIDWSWFIIFLHIPSKSFMPRSKCPVRANLNHLVSRLQAILAQVPASLKSISSPFLQIPSKGFFSKDGVLRMAALEQAEKLCSLRAKLKPLHECCMMYIDSVRHSGIPFNYAVGKAHNNFWLWRARWFSISSDVLVILSFITGWLLPQIEASNSTHSQSAKCLCEGITWILLYKSWFGLRLHQTKAISQMATKTHG